MGNTSRLVKLFNLHKKDINIVFLLFFSRFYLLLLTYVFSLIITPQANWSFVQFLHSFGNQWDAPHYIYISQNGYTNTGDQANFIVFLPLYPLLLKILNSLFSDTQVVGVIFSSVLFVFGGYFFYKMVQQNYSEKLALLSTLFLAIFSTSYFFSSGYPESLFLLLSSLVLYFSGEKSFLSAAITAGLATLTRPFGLVLWLPLLIEIISTRQKVKYVFISFFCFLLSYGVYLLINEKVYNDPFAYQKILANHWYKSFDFPWNGISAAWQKGLSGLKWDDYNIYIGLAEAIASTVSWLLIPLAYWKLKRSHFVYYLCGVILFTSTGFILSSPRYLLSLPPFFILLGFLFSNKYAKLIWGFISLTLLLYLSHRFAQGLWSF